MKRRNIISLLIFLLSSLCLCGCAAANRTPGNISIGSSDPLTLKVITEQSSSSGMNDETKSIIRDFNEQYPHVTIELEILPTDFEEREIRLTELREQIQSGGGPDIYLLPTNNLLVLDQSGQNTYRHVEPLFPNVDGAMRNGYFMDIGQFYDADKTLGKEALAESVMNAGLVGEARFVLPLRFLTPVLYSFDDMHSIGEEDLVRNIDDWMEYVISLKDPVIACGAEYISYNVFSDLIDYDSGEVTLHTDELTDYLSSLYHVEKLIGKETGHRSSLQFEPYIQGLQNLSPLRIGPLSDAIVYAAIAETTGAKLSMYPVRSTDGDYIATVSYYGAIGSNCANPEIAYQFLRMFLSEESQWESNRDAEFDTHKSGLMEQSYPVRIKGSVLPLWNVLKAQVQDSTAPQGNLDLYQRVLATDLTETDLEILNQNIDFARFPLPYENRIRSYTSAMINNAQGYSPTRVEIDNLVEEILENLSAFAKK